MSRYDNYTFSQQSKLDVDNKRRYYDSLIDPVIEKRIDDIYVITSIGERLDLLAWKYYQDPELRKDSLYLEPGLQIRVPRDYQIVLTMFNDQNSSR